MGEYNETFFYNRDEHSYFKLLPLNFNFFFTLVRSTNKTCKIKQTAIRPKNIILNISELKKFIGSGLNVYILKDGLNYMNHLKNQ